MMFQLLYITLAFTVAIMSYVVWRHTHSWRAALTYILILSKTVLLFASIGGIDRELWRITLTFRNATLRFDITVNELVIMSLLASNIILNYDRIVTVLRWR